jgi:hypothetical protein
MRVRYFGNLALGLVGATAVVVSQAYSAYVTGWLLFGLVVHELRNERTVRRFEAVPAETHKERRAEARPVAA